jgi:hypothetical protein
MRDLRLVSISEDRLHVVLRAEDTGEQFRVAAHDLRSALRGERARLGQLESHMDSALRPRDIQARIRAGATPEEVAEVAQVPVERIMGYAVPVLAEREHIVDRARLASVRRKHTDGPTRSLGDTVTAALHAQEVEPESARWDSWRREDGRWVVTVALGGNGSSQVAHYTYDAQGRYVLAEDDAARRLIADEPRAEDPTTMAMVAAVQAPASAAPVPLDAPDWSPEDCESPADAAADSPEPLQQVDDQHEGAAVTRLRRRRPLQQVAEPLPLEDPQGEHEGDASAEAGDVLRSSEPRRRRERRRASVPSWDEIMFGGGKGE